MEDKLSLRIDPEFQALVPPLSREEYDQLEANILTDGCREPLVVWGDVVVDGHNRYSICEKRGIAYETRAREFDGRDAAKEWIIRNQFGRRNLTPYARTELALKLEPLIAAKAKANQQRSSGRGKKGSQNSENLKSVDTLAELAFIAGVSPDTIHRAKSIADSAPDEEKERLRRGETSINAVYKELAKKRRSEKKAAEGKEVTSPGVGRHEVVLASLPWPDDQGEKGKKAAAIGALKSIPVEAVCAEDCVLLLPTPSAHLPQALKLLAHWGFTYQTSFVLEGGEAIEDEYSVQQHELVLLAAKGGLDLPKNPPASVIRPSDSTADADRWPLNTLVERMYPHHRRVELYAAVPREGWTCWPAQEEVSAAASAA